MDGMRKFNEMEKKIKTGFQNNRVFSFGLALTGCGKNPIVFLLNLIINLRFYKSWNNLIA